MQAFTDRSQSSKRKAIAGKVVGTIMGALSNPLYRHGDNKLLNNIDLPARMLLGGLVGHGLDILGTKYCSNEGIANLSSGSAALLGGYLLKSIQDNIKK